MGVSDIILPSHDPHAEGSADMLERFKVPKEDEVRVPEPSLRETVTAIFEEDGRPTGPGRDGVGHARDERPSGS